jgi:hypothetical protein
VLATIESSNEYFEPGKRSIWEPAAAPKITPYRSSSDENLPFEAKVRV